MRRSALLLAAMAVALLLVSGVALARTVNCDGGRCRGTDNADTMYGSNGRDQIYSLKGPPTWCAARAVSTPSTATAAGTG